MANLLGKWTTKFGEILISITSAIVFVFFDFLEVGMCMFYRVVDELLEGESASSCYCMKAGEEDKTNEIDRESELSETLHRRRNLFRDKMGSLGTPTLVPRKLSTDAKSLVRNYNVANRNRWSDCGCESCVEWMDMKDGDLRLHVVVKEPQRAAGIEDFKKEETQNVVFVHGFLSSSSFWTETVFPNLSESTERNYRLFAVDLLGFGRSPKPMNCFYTLRDHLNMIEKSVISSYELNSFHLVAHSMGCVIALALAAKYSKSVKSIVLIAPPYFSSRQGNASLITLERLATRRLWPPLLFGSSFMSWYEHLGRCVCLIICRNHKTWEWILKLVSRRRDLHFMVLDTTRHTHHSAWHTMHNVICGGAKLMDKYLEALTEARVKINVIQGAKDQVVPVECSSNMTVEVPNAEVNIIANADHYTVVLGREHDFTRDLENIWESVVDSSLMRKRN